MSVPVSCCNPCPDVQTINIPGPEGEAGTGTNGTNGVNAFTVTTAEFEVPLVDGNVTISVGNSTWAVVGQNFYVPGAGYFEVVSKPTSTSILGTYLNYAGNTHMGETIAVGTGVSPAGTQGPDQSLLPTISDYSIGGDQALTTSPAQLLTLSVTLATAGTYLLMASCRLDFDAATFSAGESVAIKLRETNTAPADIANALVNLDTGTTSAESSTFAAVALPPVVYAATAGDVIQLFGSVADTPYSGSLKAIEGSILAIPMF